MTSMQRWDNPAFSRCQTRRPGYVRLQVDVVERFVVVHGQIILNQFQVGCVCEREGECVCECVCVRERVCMWIESG